MDRCSTNRHSLLSRLGRLLAPVAHAPGSPQRTSARRDRRATLNLELLEDRLCPSQLIWTGNGSNDNWSTAQNWYNPQNPTVQRAPQAGDALFFENDPAQTVSNNDCLAGTKFDSITIAGNGYDITGNSVLLENGLHAINSADKTGAINTVALSITLADAQVFEATNGATTLILTGTIDNGGNLLTVHTGGSEIWFDGGTLTGSGGLTVDVQGKCLLEDTDTYTGITTVNSTTLYLDALNPNALTGSLVIGAAQGSTGLIEQDVVRLCTSNQIASTCAVTVDPSGLLDLDGYNDTIGSLTMTGGNVTTGSATLTLVGGITSSASSTTAVISTGPGDSAGNADLATNGVLVLDSGLISVAANLSSNAPTIDLNVELNIQGRAGVELSGGGTLQFSGDDTYTGLTEISSGELRAASAEALGIGNVKVDSAGILVDENSSPDGPLDFGPLFVNGNLTNAGQVSFDDAGTAATLVISGNYTQTSTGTLAIKLASAAVYDQVLVSETATLAGTLDVSPEDGFQPVAGQTKIMTFDSSSGSFNTVDLPHPGVLSLRYDPQDLTIVDSAKPSSGSSVSTPVVAVWTGAGGNADWLNPLNWAGDVAPQAGDALLFPSLPEALVAYNDYAPGTTFASITIAGSGYQISGNGVVLEAGLSAINSTGVNTVSLPLSLAAAESISASAGVTLVLAGSVNSGGNLLTVNADGNVLFEGASVTGSGGVAVEGSGTFTLADSNAGAIEVKSGTLVVSNAGALGAQTIVDAGATLALEGGPAGLTFASTQSLILDGTNISDPATLLNLSGNNTWNGTIKLTGTSALNAAADTTLTINGIISGPDSSNNLFTDGSGTVVLTATNTYQGHTVLEAGALVAANAYALGAWQVGTTIDAGATLELAGGGSPTGGIAYSEEGLCLNGGTLENLSGNNVLTNPIQLGSASTIVCAANSTLQDNVQLTLRSYTLTIDAVGNVDIHTDILGSGSIIKDGTGALSFTGIDTNLYTGNTTVNAGTLLLAKPAPIVSIGNAALPRSQWPTVTINAGATLEGTGIIDANVINNGVVSICNPPSNIIVVGSVPLYIGSLVINGNMTNAGVVNFGSADSVGTLAINASRGQGGNYTQTASGVLDLALGTPSASDEVMVAALASLAGTLNINLLSGSPAPGSQFKIMTFEQSSGSFGTVQLPAGLSLAYDAADAMIDALAAARG